jgi:hypothetical protein
MATPTISARHTPGPWTYEVSADGSIWLSLGNSTSGPRYEGDLVASEADARLITAAPDLLAALKMAQTIIGHPDDSASILISEIIAKAEGRS